MGKGGFAALAIVIGFVGGLVGAFALETLHPLRGPGVAQAAKETAYQRIMRTGEIRCAYANFAPYFIKDSGTGAFSGIWHDHTEAVAKDLGLKVAWTEEVGLGDVSAALDANRVDAFCGGLWSAGKRVRAMDFTRSTAFEPILAYVRIDDHRFDNDLGTMNDPKIVVSTIDGEGGWMAASDDFPKAKLASLPQLATYADMFNQVVTHKADVVFAAPPGAAAFIKNNPNTIRPILKPIRLYTCGFAIKYGENELHNMLNQAQNDLIWNGELDKILAAYEQNKNDFWRPAPPYDLPPATP
jgi:ABC-type amino acid transport substrate-binding protein